jgi:succinate dehydrogenase / fumarate reductase flavoprotein subunit
MMLSYDVLIIGGGLAGLRAAVGLCDAYSVGVLSKVHPLRSHSIAAQGGINAALANNPDGKDDTWEKHAFDTIKGSDYLADQNAVEIMCKEAIGVVYEMEHWGCPFSRFPDGSIAQRPFGGAGYPRTCYSADLTGHVLLNTLHERATAKGVNVHHEWFVLSLVTDNGVCNGVIAFDLKNGEIVPILAKTTLFATGGYGRVYLHSTNALINTGSGIGIAYKSGAPIKDMEFVQFHPTTLIGTNILITEAARGEGGYLVNKNNERFMTRYVPNAMELAPRDIVSRSIQTEINEGRGFEHPLGKYINLDLRHLGARNILEKLPGIRNICLDFIGLDPILEPIPIMPCQHYSMGGIDTNERCETGISGFYAAGECACVSVHGANRLGGNSLLDTIVFGKLACFAIDEYLHSNSLKPDEKLLISKKKEMENKIYEFINGGSEKPYRILVDLTKTMSNCVGIFREDAGLEQALRDIDKIRERFRHVHVDSPTKHMNYELLNTIELEYMIEVAHVTAIGAYLRKESRGAHFRKDFNKRNDNDWLKHTVAKIGIDGKPLISYKNVVITDYQPMVREY